MKLILEVKGPEKHYGDFAAVKDMTLDIKESGALEQIGSVEMPET